VLAAQYGWISRSTNRVLEQTEWSVAQAVSRDAYFKNAVISRRHNAISPDYLPHTLNRDIRNIASD
jgi:hypothetical protein